MPIETIQMSNDAVFLLNKFTIHLDSKLLERREAEQCCGSGPTGIMVNEILASVAATSHCHEKTGFPAVLASQVIDDVTSADECYDVS